MIIKLKKLAKGFFIVDEKPNPTFMPSPGWHGSVEPEEWWGSFGKLSTSDHLHEVLGQRSLGSLVLVQFGRKSDRNKHDLAQPPGLKQLKPNG